MNRKLEEDLEAIATSIDSIAEILFAVQLLDDGKEQVKIDTMLELPIKESERIQRKLNVYLKKEKWLENRVGGVDTLESKKAFTSG